MLETISNNLTDKSRYFLNSGSGIQTSNVNTPKPAAKNLSTSDNISFPCTQKRIFT